MRFRRLLISLALLLCVGVSPVSAAPAMGTAPGTMGPAPAMDGQWEAYDYKGAKETTEEIPSGTLVVVAYVILWGVLLGYVVLLAMRQRRLQADLDDLRRELDRREADTEAEGDRADGETPRK